MAYGSCYICGKFFTTYRNAIARLYRGKFKKIHVKCGEQQKLIRLNDKQLSLAKAALSQNATHQADIDYAKRCLKELTNE